MVMAITHKNNINALSYHIVSDSFHDLQKCTKIIIITIQGTVDPQTGVCIIFGGQRTSNYMNTL